jgi:hypothetical protein
MTDNPPPDESPAPDHSPPPPKNEPDPRRPMFRPAEPPSSEPAGCASIIGRTLLGIVSFVLSIIVFISLTASASDEPWIGVAIAAVLVAGLFAIRKHYGPSPLLGAVVVGVTTAFVVFGGCMLLISSFK